MWTWVDLRERASCRAARAYVVALEMDRPFTAARARNEGFAAIKKLQLEVRLVQFIDGDCKLDKGWLSAAVAFMAEHDDVAVVCGRRREQYPLHHPFNTGSAIWSWNRWSVRRPLAAETFWYEQKPSRQLTDFDRG